MPQLPRWQTRQGEIVAELDIHPDLWFSSAIPGDGHAGAAWDWDALWQLVIFPGLAHKSSRGRALGGEVKFMARSCPPPAKLVYHRYPAVLSSGSWS